MKQATIQLHSVTDVKRFVDFAAQCPYDIDLLSGRYAVDGKSMMGILSLDLSKPLIVQANTDDASAFFQKITSWILQE